MVFTFGSAVQDSQRRFEVGFARPDGVANAQRMRWLTSSSPTHTVLLHPAFSSPVLHGEEGRGRWWWFIFHSMRRDPRADDADSVVDHMLAVDEIVAVVLSTPSEERPPILRRMPNGGTPFSR